MLDSLNNVCAIDIVQSTIHQSTIR